MSTLTSYNGLEIVTRDPSGAGGLAINDNFKALSTALKTSNPTAGDDNTHGYSRGSRWFNTSTDVEWICTKRRHCINAQSGGTKNGDLVVRRGTVPSGSYGIFYGGSSNCRLNSNLAVGPVVPTFGLHVFSGGARVQSLKFRRRSHDHAGRHDGLDLVQLLRSVRGSQRERGGEHHFQQLLAVTLA